MLAELNKLIDQGKTNDEIYAYFVDKYGTAVLAAPPASGFNLTAWIAPFGFLVIGGIAAVVLLKRYRAKWAVAGEPKEDLTKYQSKVEEELKKFTPED